MSDDPGHPDEHTGRLLAVVNLLTEMALQTLKQGEADAARGFIDCIESLQVKVKGNIGPGEDQVFDTVLTQLRIAVVQGPPPAADEDPPSADAPAASEE